LRKRSFSFVENVSSIRELSKMYNEFPLAIENIDSNAENGKRTDGLIGLGGGDL